MSDLYEQTSLFISTSHFKDTYNQYGTDTLSAINVYSAVVHEHNNTILIINSSWVTD